MGIFDNIGSKVSATGQAAAEKARNLAEISRLNGVVSEHEKRISRLYFEIGQSYYERHKGDPNAEELERIAAINDANEKLFVCREQIKALKGVEKCPSCGADVAQGVLFCNNCGAKMPPASVRSTVKVQSGRCPTCGAAVAPGNMFCNSCGTKLPADAAPVPETKTCPTCGAILDADAAFCFSCGARLSFDTAPVNEPAPTGKKCPACGTVLEEDALFCFSCGEKLSAEEPEPAPEAAPTAEAEPIPEGKTCPLCGVELDGDAMFCYSCGTKVE